MYVTCPYVCSPGDVDFVRFHFLLWLFKLYPYPYVHSPGDGSGGFAFGLASKAGSMGARMGKKVAQSETGRRATRAAVKGACDGVRDDMLSKYSDPVPTTPTSPSSKEPSGGHHKKEEKTNNVPTWMDSDDSDEGGHMTAKTHRYHEARPPKPSLKDKFKLNMNFGRSEPQKQAPRRVRKDPKDRIYNSRLAKEPDWDKLLRVQAMYNFVGEMNCDLQFRKGQVIKVITRTESHNDWWEGQLDDRVGIFPANYVKTLS